MAIKQYIYKLYDNSGNYLKTVKDVATRYPLFNMSINSGVGQMRLQIAQSWNDFLESTDFELYNEIKVIVNDNEDNAKQIYSGFISQRQFRMNEGKEFIEITLIGYVSELTTSVLMIKEAGANYGSTGLYFTSDEPGEILEYALDSFAIFYSGKITYTADSIEATGNVTTDLFNMNTIQEAVDVVLQRSPIGWYWYVDGENVMNLKSADKYSPDHTLFLGKHIKSIRAIQNMEDVRNDVLVVGGTPDGEEQISKRFLNQSSITQYGRRTHIKNDGRLFNSTSIDFLGKYLLGSKYAATSELEFDITDSNVDPKNGYDIESISPGDVIQINNPKAKKRQAMWDIAMWDVDFWDFSNNDALGEAIIVESIQYYGTGIKVYASRSVPGVGFRLEDVKRNLENYLNATVATDSQSDEDIFFTYDDDGNLIGTT